MVRSSVYVELASELEITKALTFLKLMDIPKVAHVGCAFCWLFCTVCTVDTPPKSLTQSLTHSNHSVTQSLKSLIHSLTHPLTHSNHSFTSLKSLSHSSFTHSHTHSLTHSLTHLLTHSLTHSLTHLLTHSLTYSHSDSLTPSLTRQLKHSRSATGRAARWPPLQPLTSPLSFSWYSACCISLAIQHQWL